VVSASAVCRPAIVRHSPEPFNADLADRHVCRGPAGDGVPGASRRFGGGDSRREFGFRSIFTPSGRPCWFFRPCFCGSCPCPGWHN